MSIDLGVLIGLDILSVIILAIIMVSCVLERRNSSKGSYYFVAMLAFEIIFLIFNAFQYDTEKTIINTASLSLERQYIVMRGLSNVAFFLLLICFFLYSVSYIQDNNAVFLPSDAL